MNVAATCKLLDWKLGEGEGVSVDLPGQPVVWQLEAGRLQVEIGAEKEWIVSRATFEVAALVEVRGVPPLDVGPCDVCEGQHAVIQHEPDAADDPRELDPYPWEKYQRWLAREPAAGCAAVLREPFPCPACRVGSKPTGRRCVPAFEAVLMAAPWNDDGLHEDLHESLQSPGHEGARAALHELGAGLVGLLEAMGSPEPRADVIGDWLEAEGTDAPSSLGWRAMCGATPCPELGAWVLAWLAGPCERCSWKKGPMLFDRRIDARTWCRINGHPQRLATRHPGDVWGLWIDERWLRWGDLPERNPCECAGSAIRALLAAAWVERETALDVLGCGCPTCVGAWRVWSDSPVGFTERPIGICKSAEVAKRFKEALVREGL